jgi:hypothetical protein
MEGSIVYALDWIRMDTDSSQLLGSYPAWVHIDNQATRTTDLTQTEGGNANDEHASNLTRESLYDESTMERSEASEALAHSIVDSSDNDSLSGSDANSMRALNNPRTEDQPRVQVAGDEAASSSLQRPAVAGIKTTGLDSDEESDDEPRDREPDVKTLQAAGPKTTGLDSDEESPGHQQSRCETSGYKCGCGRFKRTDPHVCKHTPGIREEAYQNYLDSLETSEEVPCQESAQSDSTSSILVNTKGSRRSRRPSVRHASAEGTTRGEYNCGMCGVPKRGHKCPYKKQKGKKKEAEKPCPELCPVCGRRRRDHDDNTFCPN